MADDRNRNYDADGGSYNRDRQDNGRDFGSGRDYSSSGARNYEAAGEIGGRDDRNYRGGGTGYGGGSYGQQNFGGGGDRESYGSNYGGRDYYGGRQGGEARREQGSGGANRGSYVSDGRRSAEGGSSDRQRENERGGREYGRQPQGYDYQDRGFFARAGDEVRSWFGDDDAERRREADERYDERQGGYGGSNYGGNQGQQGYGRDSDYHSWRKSQIDALDRDYHEYRQENARKFDTEFGSWRTQRQTQRTSLGSVEEHMEVVGSDGEHVGTVDKVRGDRIILTKNDQDAGGRHHSIPSSWLQSVAEKVTISKTAADAKAHWRDEERSGDDTNGGGDRGANLNRSFSGTY